MEIEHSSRMGSSSTQPQDCGTSRRSAQSPLPAEEDRHPDDGGIMVQETEKAASSSADEFGGVSRVRICSAGGTDTTSRVGCQSRHDEAPRYQCSGGGSSSSSHDEDEEVRNDGRRGRGSSSATMRKKGLRTRRCRRRGGSPTSSMLLPRAALLSVVAFLFLASVPPSPTQQNSSGDVGAGLGIGGIGLSFSSLLLPGAGRFAAYAEDADEDGDGGDDDGGEDKEADDDLVDLSDIAFGEVSVMPVSCLRYNNGHMIKFEYFENTQNYQCHFKNLGTFVVSIAHYMRAYFNNQALIKGRDFKLPGDAGYLNCVLLRETAYTGQKLYAKIGCMERETFTSTKLQLHVYQDAQCSQAYDDGRDNRQHVKNGYDINGYSFSSKVSFRPPFYTCQTCAPDQVSDSFRKSNSYWYDDDYISQYGQRAVYDDDANGGGGGDDANAGGDDANAAADDGNYGYGNDDANVNANYYQANDDIYGDDENANQRAGDDDYYKADDAANGDDGNGNDDGDDGPQYSYWNWKGNNNGYRKDDDDDFYARYDDDRRERRNLAAKDTGAGGGSVRGEITREFTAAPGQLEMFEREFWNEWELQRRQEGRRAEEDAEGGDDGGQYGIGNWNMCQQIYKYGLWCDAECRALDTFRVDEWSASDIFLLVIMCLFLAAMMLLVFAKRVKAYEKASIYGDDVDTPYPGLPPMAMVLIFILIMTVILVLANLKFVNETLVFAVVTCILLFIYMLKLTLFESRKPGSLLPTPRQGGHYFD